MWIKIHFTYQIFRKKAHTQIRKETVYLICNLQFSYLCFCFVDTVFCNLIYFVYLFIFADISTNWEVRYVLCCDVVLWDGSDIGTVSHFIATLFLYIFLLYRLYFYWNFWANFGTTMSFLTYPLHCWWHCWPAGY